LPFGGPLGLSYEEQRQTAAALQEFINKEHNKDLLNLDPGMEYRLPSFHPLYRINRTGSIRWDLVVEVVQTKPATQTTFPLRGGTTMIVSTHSTGGGGQKDAVFLRYVISKPLTGRDGESRTQQQINYFQQQGIKPGLAASQLRVNFAFVHGGI